jgi:hypothetical protein
MTVRLPSKSFMSTAAAVTAVVVAIVAVAAAYLISHTDSPRGARSAAIDSASGPAYPTPVLAGALSPETGPDGTPWQWIGESASFELANLKKGWIAFRALSSHGPRRLDFDGPAGERLSARIQTAPRLYLVGPLSGGRVLLHASSAGAKPRHLPQLAVFLSTLRAMPNPVAAMPESDFWATENAGGVVFNWMAGRGTIEVYAPRIRTGHVRLTFVARSLEQGRTLTVQSGADSDRVDVTTTAQAFTVGPFELVGGRARVLMRPSPGPKHYGTDPRLLSVQVASLGGSASSTEP